MPINYIPRRFTVIRDKELCINCGCCVRQCSNECHYLPRTEKQSLQIRQTALHATGALTFARQAHCVLKNMFAITEITQTGLRSINRKSAARQTPAQRFCPQWATQSRSRFIGTKFCLMHHRLQIRQSTLCVSLWKSARFWAESPKSSP